MAKPIKNGHLVAMMLLLLVLSVLLLLGSGGVAASSMLDKVEVEVEDIEFLFTDKKNKKITPDFGSLTNPLETAGRIRAGYIRATLDFTVVNNGAFPITADEVSYRVTINKKYAGKGKLPEKGEGPVTINPGEPFDAKVKIKVPTKKILSKVSPEKLISGGKLVFRVTGTATGKALGLSLERKFSIKKTKRYGP